jgi:hypothetical protein
MNESCLQGGGAPEFGPGPATQAGYTPPPGGPPPESPREGGEWRNRALMLAAFVLGVGAGVWFTEDVNLYPNNVASTELIDRRTPNSEVCMANGYSAMVFDQRIFVSFNPCASSQVFVTEKAGIIAFLSIVMILVMLFLHLMPWRWSIGHTVVNAGSTCTLHSRK